MGKILKPHFSVEVDQAVMCVAVRSEMFGLMLAFRCEFGDVVGMNASPGFAFAAIWEPVLAEARGSQMNLVGDRGRNSVLSIP